jgi:hypothetical protein
MSQQGTRCERRTTHVIQRIHGLETRLCNDLDPLLSRRQQDRWHLATFLKTRHQR